MIRVERYDFMEVLIGHICPGDCGDLRRTQLMESDGWCASEDPLDPSDLLRVFRKHIMGRQTNSLWHSDTWTAWLRGTCKCVSKSGMLVKINLKTSPILDTHWWWLGFYRWSEMSWVFSFFLERNEHFRCFSRTELLFLGVCAMTSVFVYSSF